MQDTAFGTTTRHASGPDVTIDRNDLRLRGVTDDGRLEAIYSVLRNGDTIQDHKHVSVRLPLAAATLFDGDGVLDPAALTDEERAWLEWEGEFSFEEVAR